MLKSVGEANFSTPTLRNPTTDFDIMSNILLRPQGVCHGRVRTCRPMGACIARQVISIGGVCGRC